MASKHLALVLLLTSSLTACGNLPRLAASVARGPVQAMTRAAYATALAPKDVPADVVKTALGPAQAAADEASKRRQIDYFALPTNPLGLRIGTDASAVWVLSFLGTSKQDADLNIELRAFVAGSQVGTSLDYSGQTTQSRRLGLFLPGVTADEPPSFELLTGLPGNGIADEYSDYLDHLGEQLVDQYQAQPFHWDDTPMVFAVHQHGSVTGYVFTDQGNQLVVGDNKYADVQSVAWVGADGNLTASYTIVGFNRKTSKPGAAPTFHVEKDDRFGLIARCGQAP